MHAFAITCALLLATWQTAALPAAAPPSPPLRNAVDVPARQMKLRIGTIAATAVPGKPIDLVAEIVLAPKMHVYAPGQTDYIPITLTLTESADVTAEPVSYPAPESLYLEPIKATAKVYEKTFRVTQRVTIKLSPDVKRRAAAGEAVPITATLRYQACDDAVCYRPETVKLTWRVKLAAR
jgi:DsbC/DsbD-like thiol-disulfide interchange protein